MKHYALVRDVDESGVSGTGHIAWAVEFPHGVVAVSFRDDTAGPGVKSVAAYFSLDDAKKVHGHGGKTRFVEVDQRIPLGHSMTPYTSGQQCAIQDECENVPAACIRGGRDFAPDGHEDEWLAGYLDAGRSMYGADWREPGAFKNAPKPTNGGD
jgi:hypothetical protein